MVTANTDGPELSQDTSIMRLGRRCRSAALGQSERWTLTPCPRVTNPMIGSRGTGVQHRASLTQTSSTPLTSTPRLAGLAEGADQRLLAGLDGVLATLLGEPLPDLVTRPRCLDDRQPVPRRTGVGCLGGEDLDRLAVLERVLQRHQPLVDARAHAAVADLGVHGVGEVDRGRARRELEDVPLGGEDEHLVDVEVGLEVVDEVLGVRQLALPVDELP